MIEACFISQIRKLFIMHLGFHKEDQDGFLFLNHMAKVTSYLGVPKPLAVPTYYIHCDGRGCVENSTNPKRKKYI